MNKRGVLTRRVSTQLPRGKVVHRYMGNRGTAVLGYGGVAVTDKPGRGWWYEVPENAVEWD